MLKETIIDALQDEQIVNEVKRRVVEKITWEISRQLSNDYASKIAGEIAETVIKDEEFLTELEKIKEGFRQKIITQILDGLGEALNSLKIEVTTWKLNDSLRDAVSLRFED